MSKTKEEILKPFIYKNVECFGDAVTPDGAEEAMETYACQREEGAVKLLHEKDQQLSEARAEIERLKGLIETAFSSAYNRGYMDCRDKVKNEANPFGQFKIDHNL